MTTSTVEQPVAVPDAPAPEPVASEVEAGRAQAPETSAEETPTTEETKPTEASAPVQAPEPAEDSKPANELSETPLPAVAEPDPAGDAPTAAEVERDAKQETSGPNEQKSVSSLFPWPSARPSLSF